MRINGIERKMPKMGLPAAVTLLKNWLSRKSDEQPDKFEVVIVRGPKNKPVINMGPGLRVSCKDATYDKCCDGSPGPRQYNSYWGKIGDRVWIVPAVKEGLRGFSVVDQQGRTRVGRFSDGWCFDLKPSLRLVWSIAG